MSALSLKLVGAVLLVGCGGWLGRSAAERLRLRAEFYGDLVALCELFKYNATHRRECFDAFFEEELAHRAFSVLRFAPQQGQGVGRWRSGMPQIWFSSVPLTGAEQKRVCDFWNSLGSRTAKEEIELLDYYAALFGRQQKEARRQEGQSARVYRSLGLCGGAVLAILLL